MRPIMLALLAVAALAASAAAKKDCKQQCWYAKDPAACEQACHDANFRADEHRVGGAALTTGHLDVTKVEGLSDEELKLWGQEYFNRKEALTAKCKAAEENHDPKLDQIQKACDMGQSDIQTKIVMIEGEQRRRFEKKAKERERAAACAEAEAKRDAKAYCGVPCGECAQKADATWEPVAWRKKPDAARKSGKKAKGNEPPADCAGLYDKHLSICLGKGVLSRAGCEDQARRTSKAECDGLKRSGF